MTIGRQGSETRGAAGGEPGAVGVKVGYRAEAAGKDGGSGDGGVRALRPFAACLAAVFVLGAAEAKECPWNEADPLWMQAACDFNDDQAVFQALMAKARSLAELSTDDLNYRVLLALSRSYRLELGDEHREEISPF